MEIISSLQNKYGLNNPIFIEEIRSMFSNYSKIRIAQLIQKAIDSKELIRFENGIYYIPSKSLLGISSLSANKVIEKKYLKNNNEICGFYCGLSFLNYLGFIDQVPNVYEIMTNKESTRRRKIKVGNQKVILRKSRINIDSKNYIVLQFLEFITSTDIQFLLDNKEKIKIYFEKNIVKKEIKQYINQYPAKTFKKIYTLELL